MIDRLLSRGNRQRWLVYLVSNCIIAGYLALTTSAGVPISTVQGLLALGFSVGVILTVSEILPRGKCDRIPAAADPIRETADVRQAELSSASEPRVHR